jgi:solute carrier family 26 (sodium-independent sulfate anion transporter), member 11
MAHGKLTQNIASLLGITLCDDRHLEHLEPRLHHEVHSIFREQDPTVSGWVGSLVPNQSEVSSYCRSLFPSADWITRYNLRWLMGDSIAGITIGFVVVPQAMAYAVLAELSPEYGLYTSFTGLCVYWLFGTSKDIVIGVSSSSIVDSDSNWMSQTTAIGSLLVGSVITSIEEQRPDVYSRTDIAKTLSFITGAILLAAGLIRAGNLVELIPYVPISAFVTAAALQIIATQFPVAMGIPNINTREAPYKVYINTLKGLPNTHLDAAIGLSCLVFLYIVREICARLEVKQPSKRRFWALASSMRLSFAMLLMTFISFLVNRNHSSTPKFRIVGTIEKGKHLSLTQYLPGG